LVPLDPRTLQKIDLLNFIVPIFWVSWIIYIASAENPRGTFVLVPIGLTVTRIISLFFERYFSNKLVEIMGPELY